MKNILILTLLILLAAIAPAHADKNISQFTPTTTIGTTSLLPYWDSTAPTATATSQISMSNFNNVANGLTGANTAQGALNNFFAYPAGNSAPIIPPCTGSGDETPIANAITTAQGRKTTVLVSDGCQPANQNILTSGGNTSITGLGQGPAELGTNAGVGPRISVFSPGIAANAPGAAWLDMHAPRGVYLNNLNIFGSDNKLSATLIENSAQFNCSSCAASNVLSISNSSLGNSNGVIGCPVDGALNCIIPTGVASLNISAPGSGYGINTCTQATPLTGGSGTGAAVGICSNGSGAISFINVPNQGTGYVVGDVLSFSNAPFGGTGSGATFTVTTIGRVSTPTTANILPRLQKIQISDFGCGICANFSDLQVYNSEFTSGLIGIQPIFGGGANQIANNRFEFMQNSVIMGGPNTGGGGNASTFINSNNFTHNIGPDIILGGGNGYVVVGNDFNQTQTDNSNIVLGGTATLTGVTVVGNTFDQNFLNNLTHCVTILAGHTVDYINMQGDTCNPGSGLVANVRYDTVPTHIVEDFVGPFGRHVEQGRKFAIQVMTNTNTMDVGGNIAIGTGTAYAGIGTSAGTVAPLNGAIIEGSVGIGTNSPSSLLQVGSATTSGVGLTLVNSSGTCTHAAGSSSETVSCSSDAALKQNIQPAKTIMPWLWSFKIRSFDMKADGEHKEVGVIAQEVMKNHPEMVHDGANGYLAVEEPDPWYLVKAVQETQSEINLLGVFMAGNFIYICGVGFFAFRNRRRRKKLEQAGAAI